MESRVISLLPHPLVGVSTRPGIAPPAVCHGRGHAITRLTRRECEVLRLLLYRQTDREIADRLSISRRTASCHVASILRKLGARNRREAAFLALAAEGSAL